MDGLGCRAACEWLRGSAVHSYLPRWNAGDGVHVQRCYGSGANSRGTCGGTASKGRASPLSVCLRAHRERGFFRTADFESSKPCRISREHAAACSLDGLVRAAFRSIDRVDLSGAPLVLPARVAGTTSPGSRTHAPDRQWKARAGWDPPGGAGADGRVCNEDRSWTSHLYLWSVDDEFHRDQGAHQSAENCAAREL